MTSIEYLGQENCVYFLASFESFKNFCPLNMAKTVNREIANIRFEAAQVEAYFLRKRSS